ncbi:MAG: hypothetical protein H0X53_03455 [Sphingomonas sp.]|nr:hypothetical protein [Sphingomonas sp.]
MRSAIIATAAAALAVSGCGTPEDRETQARPIEVRSAQQEELHQLNDLNRDIALKRAVRDSGYRCQQVTESGFVVTYQNLDMWTASCDDGRRWAIFTGPDGSAQVRDCKDVAEFGLPDCRIESKPKEGNA